MRAMHAFALKGHLAGDATQLAGTPGSTTRGDRVGNVEWRRCHLGRGGTAEKRGERPCVPSWPRHGSLPRAPRPSMGHSSTDPIRGLLREKHCRKPSARSTCRWPVLRLLGVLRSQARSYRRVYRPTAVQRMRQSRCPRQSEASNGAGGSRRSAAAVAEANQRPIGW